jgi:hypothetical protein
MQEKLTKEKIIGGCKSFVLGCLGILLVGALLMFFMNRDKEYNIEYPWYGSVWYTYSSSTSVFGDQQFKTLAECREWALKQGSDKDLDEGAWSYSCGFNCDFTDQNISGGRKVNNYECQELTQ